MATVYLLDLSAAARSSSPSSSCLSSSPPLSWWCAGELSQWASAVAVRDAWAAAAPPPPPVLSSHAPDRSGYTAFNDDGDIVDEQPQQLSFASSTSLYQLCTFPSAVTARNKYFSTSLRLVTGSSAFAVSPEVFAEMSAQLRHSTASLPEHSSYGGVLLVDIAQDPAEVPWHVLPRGGRCHFRVVMVYLEAGDDDSVEKEDAEDDSGRGKRVDEQHTPSHVLGQKESISRCYARATAADVAGGGVTQQRKDRWRYFAVENGYECVFHAAVAAATDAKVKTVPVVSTASGSRGLLGASLTGSDRLYQILCNTLWPTEVRTDVTAKADASALIQSERVDVGCARSAPTVKGNGLVVVGNSVQALRQLFPHVGPTAASATAAPTTRTRRQLRFFTAVLDNCFTGSRRDGREHLNGSSTSHGVCEQAVALPALAHADRDHRSAAMVLVNKYYAAVVRPRLLQTAFFSAEMQDMLDRYWEQHLAADSSLAAPCVDAPALVLWPPVSLGEGATVTQQVEDTRGSYPALEVVIDALRRHGCAEVVVVVVGPPAPSALPTLNRSSADALLSTRVPRQANVSTSADTTTGLTPYELQVCADRSVEVVDLHSTPNNAFAREADQNDPPVPVLNDEDDVSATRAADRLAEILHCVQWGHSHPLPSLQPDPLLRAHYAPSHEKGQQRNTCAVVAYGGDAFQEEAWLCDLAAALRAPPSTALLKNDKEEDNEEKELEQERHALVCAAVSVAARLENDGNSSHPSDSSPSDVTVSTAYFTATVQLCFYGGLEQYYRGGSAVPSADAATASLPPKWAELADGFVVVTSLSMLQEAADAAAGVVVCTEQAQRRPSYELLHVISTLAYQADQWMAAAQHTLMENSAALPEAQVDSPLALIYVADVAASDEDRVALAETSLRSIAESLHASDEDADDGDGANFAFLPVEVVFAADASAGHNTAPAGKSWEAPLDGVQRIREAMEQHLWPHRRPPRTNSSTTAAAADVQSKEVEALTKEADHVEETESSSQVQNVKDDDGVAKMTDAQAASSQSVWRPPLIGCALPPGYLIDPETLRSVLLPAVSGVSQLRAMRQQSSLAEGASSTSSTEKPKAKITHRRPTAQEEEELMAWMEKMKTHGHRLGEAQRKEQAALLALTLENLL